MSETTTTETPAKKISVAKAEANAKKAADQAEKAKAAYDLKKKAAMEAKEVVKQAKASALAKTKSTI